MLLFLENMGLEVVCVDSAEACLASFRAAASSYDLVLVNYDMPTKNGVELLRELRIIAPAVRIALTSGYPERQVLAQLGPQEVVPFLQKPYNRAKLRRFLLSNLAAVQPAVLAVLHSVEMQNQISEQLSSEFAIRRFRDPAEALWEARRGFSSVVVLDLEASEADQETLHSLKLEGIPLVFLTTASERTAHLRRLGEVLPSNVGDAELTRAIRRAVRQAVRGR